MNTYPKYKDSGIEWIGEIPEHWEMKRIRHLAEIYGRIGYRGYKVTDLVQKGEGAITISPSNMKAFHMEFNSCTYLSWDKYMESPEIMIYNSDILFVKTGSTYGKSSFVQDLPEKATINPQIIVLKNIVSDNKLLWYIIISNNIQFQVEQSVVGGTIPTISQARINNYLFPIPPTKTEQTAIANYLDLKTADLDHLIAEKKQLVKLYQEEKTAIINRAVTKGINPSVNLKDSGIEWLGDIPEHWEVKKLKYVAKLKSGNNIISQQIKEDDKYPVYGGNGLRGYFNDWTHNGRYILIGRQGAYCGNIKYTKGKFWASEHAITLTSIIKYENLYLGELLRTMNLNQYSVSAAQPGISVEVIKNLYIPFPQEKEQTVIIYLIEKESQRIDAKIKKAKKYIKLLTEYRTALISEVVTGKIKVT